MSIPREARIWRVTEADSNALSLPTIVEWFREGLKTTLQRQYPVTWEDVARIAKQELRLPTDTFTVEDDTDLAGQVWALAAVWAKYMYPDRSHKAYNDFGQAVAELSVQDLVSLGGGSRRMVAAKKAAEEMLRHPRLEGAPTDVRTKMAVKAMIGVLF